TPRVWFSVLEPVAEGLEISHRTLDYDHAGAAAAMQLNRLPPPYEQAISSGLWPSCDVLPTAAIHSAGIPLEAATVVWKPHNGRADKQLVQLCRPTLMRPRDARDVRPPLAVDKFKSPFVTAKGEPRAQVTLTSLDTLWFNTGTLCNITCRNCYIESSPRND